MGKIYLNEKWKEVKLPNDTKFRYAVSNYGRMISFTNKISDGQILKGSRVADYPVFSCSMKVKGKRKDKKIFIHKLVAQQFVKKKSSKHEYVIHLDRKRKNASADNLKWVTKEEMMEHYKKSPKVIAARKKMLEEFRNDKRKNYKLNKKQALSLKKKIADPKRKISLKELAANYGISEMQLYRIKSGENWGYIKV